MTQIGQFTRTKTGYTGKLRTLLLDIEVAIVPLGNSDVENTPDYRIHLGAEDGPEIGAGWKHTGERAGVYVSIVLDDPSLMHPIRARLFQSDDNGRDWGLHWTRQKKREEQD
ncbi:MAG: hypothetical protein ABS76_29415 [Pelagibacterium sp. SCN 64-44]|nr:MAG: hypothetical protein ABS76_29415 [Pelagibacterium sp. SCN 64-44]